MTAPVAPHDGRGVTGSTKSVSERDDLVTALHALDRAGYGDTVLGHLTVAIPGTELYWTNGLGVPWSVIRPDDLIVVDRAARLVEGNLQPNPAIGFHMEIYASRPDVNCVVHSHPMHLVALGVIGRTVGMYEQTSCMFAGGVSLMDEYGGLAVDELEGRSIAAAVSAHDAAILRNHGVVVVGADLRETVVRAVYLERSARLTLMVAPHLDARPIDEHVAIETRAMFSVGGFAALAWSSLATEDARMLHSGSESS